MYMHTLVLGKWLTREGHSYMYFYQVFKHLTYLRKSKVTCFYTW